MEYYHEIFKIVSDVFFVIPRNRPEVPLLIRDAMTFVLYYSSETFEIFLYDPLLLDCILLRHSWTLI